MTTLKNSLSNYIPVIASIVILSAVSLFSSCSDYDYGYDREDVANARLIAEYNESFAQTFGVRGTLHIDPEHNWGFKDIVPNEQPQETRVAIPNANQWGGDPYYLDVPYPLTQNQKDFVTNWFSTTENPTGIACSWTDYFAQQVSSTDYGRNMDLLYDNGENGDNHVFNFNSGNCSPTFVMAADGQWQDRIMFMQGQSTRSFSYHESVSDKTWYDHYVIIPGELIDPTNSLANNVVKLKDANGNPVKDKQGKDIEVSESIWGMYFLGFDYEAYKFEGSPDNVARDWYFNDWIIKITPGMITKPEPVRIMAEDLGDIGDFDFNDVVIDVYINYNQDWHGADYGIIVLQAAGGTMPLYVEANPNEPAHEVHEEFGVPTTQIVNTPDAAGTSVTRPVALWRFTPTSANPIDIKLIVENTIENIRYEIGSEIGVAPGKFAVPTTVQWSPECVNIETTYPKFVNWVEDQNNHFWE